MTGDLLASGATLCWSAANVSIARGSAAADGGHGSDNGAFLSILLTAVLATGLWLAVGGNRSPVNLPGVLWYALSGMLSIFIGRVFLHSSIQWVGAVRGASIMRLMPLFSVLLAITLLGESLTPNLVAGMVLMFSGFGVLAHESARAPS